MVNVTIRSNVFYNFTRGWAIQRYDGAGALVANLQIVNNTFAGANPNKDGQIIIATGVRGLVIANNIFYEPRTAGIWFDSGFVTGLVANNLTDRASISTGPTSGLTFAGNLLNRDPRFRDAARADFHLLPGSPAIGAGGRLGRPGGGGGWEARRATPGARSGLPLRRTLVRFHTIGDAVSPRAERSPGPADSFHSLRESGGPRMMRPVPAGYL